MATITKKPASKVFWGSKIESEKNLVEVDKSGKVMLSSCRMLANDTTKKTSFSISKEAIAKFNSSVKLGDVENARKFSIAGKSIMNLIMDTMKLNASERGDEKTPSKWNKPRYVYNRFIHAIGRDDLRHEFGLAGQAQSERVKEIKKQFKTVTSYLASQK